MTGPITARTSVSAPVAEARRTPSTTRPITPATMPLQPAWATPSAPSPTTTTGAQSAVCSASTAPGTVVTAPSATVTCEQRTLTSHPSPAGTTLSITWSLPPAVDRRRGHLRKSGTSNSSLRSSPPGAPECSAVANTSAICRSSSAVLAACLRSRRTRRSLVP